MDKILTMSDITSLSNDALITAYRNGFKLNVNENLIKSLATCADLPLNAVKTLTNTSSGGSGALSYTWDITKPDGTHDTSKTVSSFSYTFDQKGTYTVKTTTKDSCAGGIQSKSDTCTFTVGGVSTSAGCTNCDLSTNYCIPGINYCIPKNYALIGGAALAALLLLRK